MLKVRWKSMPEFRFWISGIAVSMTAILVGVLCYAGVPSMKEAGVSEDSSPSQFSGVRVKARPNPFPEGPRSQASFQAGSEVHLDEDGNRIVPNPGDPIPIDHPQPSFSKKAGFTYEERAIGGGLKILIPSSPIQTYSIVEIDEDGTMRKDCVKLPESALRNRSLPAEPVKEGASK